MRAALKLALEALETKGEHHPRVYQAITAIKEALAQPEQTNTRPYYTIDELNAWADEKEKQAWRNAAIRVGEELSSVGPDGYYDMNAWQWLDWAMEQQPRGKNSLAQPEQKQNLKLMPREATPEMLKAMDECSTEGYDERLYEGHAGSVYMAAWDAFYGQHCYCGDITNLGVIHRDDGPCYYPEHKEPQQEPVAWLWELTGEVTTDPDRADGMWKPLYTTPPQRKLVGLTDEEMQAVVDAQPLVSSINVYLKAFEAKLKEKNT